MQANHRRVAIVGGGAAGISAARSLSASSSFESIFGFEQKGVCCTGIWTLPPQKNHAGGKATPTDIRDNAVHDEDASAMYEDLETNIPKELMAFRGYPFPSNANLFPHRREVEHYLRAYGKGLEGYFRFNTKVVNVSRNDDPSISARWRLDTVHTVSGLRNTFLVDAVVICTGHYQVYHVPFISGLDQFSGIISHSKFYRQALDFLDRSVLVVGAGPSATDLLTKLHPVVRKPIYLSTASATNLPENLKSCQILPRIKNIKHSTLSGDAIEFADGQELNGIDLILFCTGFKYAFEFLQIGPRLADDGKSLLDLYHHIFYEQDFSLAFLGLGMRIVPFPQCQIEACVLARVWSGDLELPCKSSIEAWSREEKRRTAGRSSLQNFGYPDDFQRYEELRLWALKSRVSLNDIPSQMTTRDKWLRKMGPSIKLVWQTTKAADLNFKTPEELGFSENENL